MMANAGQQNDQTTMTRRRARMMTTVGQLYSYHHHFRTAPQPPPVTMSLCDSLVSVFGPSCPTMSNEGHHDHDDASGPPLLETRDGDDIPRDSSHHNKDLDNHEEYDEYDCEDFRLQWRGLRLAASGRDWHSDCKDVFTIVFSFSKCSIVVYHDKTHSFN